ncbi:MAG: hypothetical protein LH645_06830 [Actinomycetia bacterium]|nr:hypothetical protein [Actinomycetes bacterium]
MHRTTRRIVGTTFAAAVASTLFLSAPSAGAARIPFDPSTVGLFGQQDPTFDGVYRQSLSLIALDAAGARVPDPSVQWLLRQQCGNGRFPSYTDVPTRRCGVGDGDATALATIALKAVGKRGAARDAMNWLLGQQTRSGGWEFSSGFGPNSNTTGLVVQSMIAMGIKPSTVKTQSTGPQFLRSLQLGCSTDVVADRGALDYQKQSPLAANDFATAQAAQALAGASLPVEPATTDSSLPAFLCTPGGPDVSPSAAAAGYLGRVIDANAGAIPSSFGPGADYGSTANAVLSLVAAGYGGDQIAAAILTLETNAVDFTRDDSDAVLPASAAALVLAAHATSGDPRSVGVTNPVRDILDSRTLAG